MNEQERSSNERSNEAPGPAIEVDTEKSAFRRWLVVIAVVAALLLAGVVWLLAGGEDVIPEAEPDAEPKSELVAEFGDDVAATTDSRAIPRGALFVALQGERFDGHDYLEAVAAAGADLDRTDPDGTTALVIEAAVLYEAGWDTLCDEVWAVVSSETTALRRLQAGKRMSEQAGRARIAAQMNPRERAERADAVITNDGDLFALKVQVEGLWKARKMERHFS
jgi:hypothetical protein